MKNIALLSMDSLEDFVCYDELLIEPMAEKGCQVSIVSWREEVDWNDFDAVIVRSTWDYQDDPESFLEVLNRIENSSAVLENSIDIMKWNFDKRYMKDLESRGIIIIPSSFYESFDYEAAVICFSKWSCKEIVIKPTVSANSDDTFRLTLEKLQSMKTELEKLFSDRSHMVQPFMKSIVEKGEFSLFYFNGEFSHCILKTPKEGDFRVQEEHGGILNSVQPPEAMINTAAKVVAAIQPTPLYGRIDLVNFNGGYALMEVELIEPSLYFNMDSGSAKRFTDAFFAKING